MLPGGAHHAKETIGFAPRRGVRRAVVTQEQIDRLPWFHDFDFPEGLTARSADRENSVFHRILWRFVGDALRSLDITGKSVLDVGCWDGYFSFLAEELGAGQVLAVDDISQNWGSAACFALAKTLKRSNVHHVPDLSVYALSERLREQFDVVLFLGVYYHLHAPFAAFAQLRARCHEQSVVLIQGECIRDDDRSYAAGDLASPRASIWVPTTKLLTDTLAACYLDVERVSFLSDLGVGPMLSLAPPGEVLAMVRQRLRSRSASEPSEPPLREHARRDVALVVARPFSGVNRHHVYPPPFGLARFDTRANGGAWRAEPDSDR